MTTRQEVESRKQELTITATRDFSAVEQILRETTLLNETIEGFHPYLPSLISLEEVSPSQLHPIALYVLQSHLKRTEKLRDAFLQQGIDILNLTEEKTRITYNWGDRSNITISPPIVEVSEDDGGLWVITDGLHRVVTAKDLSIPKIRIVLIRNTAAPLIALPVAWSEVKRFNEVPPLELKRKYRFSSPQELVRWNISSQRNYERFMSGFADPFVKLGMMHVHDLNSQKPSV